MKFSASSHGTKQAVDPIIQFNWLHLSVRSRFHRSMNPWPQKLSFSQMLAKQHRSFWTGQFHSSCGPRNIDQIERIHLRLARQDINLYLPMMNQELLIALESGSEALAKVNSLDSHSSPHRNEMKRVPRNDALFIFLFLSDLSTACTEEAVVIPQCCSCLHGLVLCHGHLSISYCAQAAHLSWWLTVVTLAAKFHMRLISDTSLGQSYWRVLIVITGSHLNGASEELANLVGFFSVQCCFTSLKFNPCDSMSNDTYSKHLIKSIDFHAVRLSAKTLAHLKEHTFVWCAWDSCAPPLTANWMTSSWWHILHGICMDATLFRCDLWDKPCLPYVPKSLQKVFLEWAPLSSFGQVQ